MLIEHPKGFEKNAILVTNEAFLACFQAQKARSLLMRSEPISARKIKLKKLRLWIKDNQQEILKAVFNDFQKPEAETMAHEILPVLSEIKHALTHLDRWTKPKKVDAPITFLGTFSHIQFEPKGVVLIISPWNFPFSLCLGPLVSAIAAGNTAIVKPSEMTPHTSRLIAKMIPEIFNTDEVAVFEGDVDVSKQLLRLPFDHIFFTGSPAVGKLVMKAAAENLSAVTLELGGKSPVIVDETVNIRTTARRIAWAKFVNNGQICVTPDYAFVHENIYDEFLEAVKRETIDLFTAGENNDFRTSPFYGRIVNDRHTRRLLSLIDDARNKGAKIFWGGESDIDKKFIAPTIITNISPDAAIMEEEIFGPILPVMVYENLEDVVGYINAKPKPLALYVFTHSNRTRDYILKSASSGTACINDCVLQFAHANLPFGGVNNSGIGKSHGHYGFLAFSNEKAVLKQKRGLTALSFFYPPYSNVRKKIIELVLKFY